MVWLLLYIPVLNFLLVLGRIPGTNYVITFTELELIFNAWMLYAVWKMHEKDYKRWLKWAWYRTCVNYRKTRRRAISYIRYRRYRLAVFERRQKRAIKNYFRRQWRQLLRSIYLFYSFNIKRPYYVKQVELERGVRKIKRSRPVQFFINLRSLINQSV